MYNPKPIDTLVEKGLTMSQDQYPKTDDEMEIMSNVSHASVVGCLM